MVIYLPTEHVRALSNLSICVRAFQIELEFGNAGTSSKLNPHNLLRRVRESNPGPIGGRRALSPLSHSCFPTSRTSKFTLEVSMNFVRLYQSCKRLEISCRLKAAIEMRSFTFSVMVQVSNVKRNAF